MSFKVGDLAVHSREGVVRIFGIKNNGEKDYFCIEQVEQDIASADTILVPVDNAHMLLRPLLSKEEARTILDEIQEIGFETFSNTKQRRDNFHKRSSSGDPRDLGFLIRQLYLFKKLNSEGVMTKLGPSDVMVLENAKTKFFKELAIVFDIDFDHVEDLFIK